jgi:hypothetical protein
VELLQEQEEAVLQAAMKRLAEQEAALAASSSKAGRK